MAVVQRRETYESGQLQGVEEISTDPNGQVTYRAYDAQGTLLQERMATAVEKADYQEYQVDMVAFSQEQEFNDIHGQFVIMLQNWARLSSTQREDAIRQILRFLLHKDRQLPEGL